MNANNFLNAKWVKVIMENPYFPVIFSMALLCVMAIYNGYPFFFNIDSALYIDRAYQGVIGPDRPMPYGLFIKYTSMGTSLWFTIIVQAFLVSGLVYLYFSEISSKAKANAFFLGYFMLVSLCMSSSFYVSYLMPDIFTAILILCIGLLLFKNNLGVIPQILVSLLFIISLSMHNAHIYLCTMIALLLLSGFLITKIRLIYRTIGIQLKRVLLVFLLIMGGYLFSSVIYYSYTGEFKSSRGGVVFLMGNLVEMGLVDSYLAENCGKKEISLCQYKDTIPNNFLWAPNSPIRKNGGWEGNEEEYTSIVKDMLTTPKYMLSFLYSSGIYTAKQFFNFDAGYSTKPFTFANTTVLNYYPQEHKKFVQTRQNTGLLNFRWLNFLQNLVFAICMFIYGTVLLYKRMTLPYRTFIVFMVVCLVVNAWVYSTFSAVDSRYQSHLIWLLPLPLFVYLAEHGRVKFLFAYLSMIASLISDENK